ncbi:MAG TPA: XrtA/PEP-CTERM system histidine kinase PrsK [Gammaproteobacteria bacterium]
MEYFGIISYTLAALAFFAFAGVVASQLKQGGQVLVLFAALLLSSCWAGAAAYLAAGAYFESLTLEALESLRNIAWTIFLYVLLLAAAKNTRAYGMLKKLSAFIYLLIAGLVVLIIYFTLDMGFFISDRGYEYRAISHLLFAALGLFLVEQLMRQIDPDQRWAIKYLCFGLGGMFAYEFYLYGDALLFRSIDPDIWDARGMVNAFTVPLIAISASRYQKLTLHLFVSHKFAFHTTALLAGGFYLLAMGMGGYYIKVYGGSWGGVMQAVFLFGAAVVLLALLFSGAIRASIRVFLAKHFYHYRYDYREEWLKITELLSGQAEPHELQSNALRAIADIVESPAGLLWLQRDMQDYELVLNWNLPASKAQPIAGNDSMIRFLASSQWIIDLDEYANDSSAYRELRVPQWLRELSEAWLIVPLMHQSRLLGFTVLTHARAKDNLDWEIRDLLRTAGRQVAGYLALLEVSLALASARQFEAFNRLSAFVVHDLKNIVAQLSLILKNADQHKANPLFIDDALSTISHATQKMNRLLAQLRIQHSAAQNITRLKLPDIVRQVVKNRSLAEPRPVITQMDDSAQVLADKDRLAAIIEHLVQNAQEATARDGFVKLRVYTEQPAGQGQANPGLVNQGRVNRGHIKIAIEDNGCGMSEEFIRDRLFKPFETTKGNAGMGIGVYEACEFVKALGGRIEVSSRIGEGSTFLLSLPLAESKASEEVVSTPKKVNR